METKENLQFLIFNFFSIQGSADHCMIGVQLLSQLTCEMNQVIILVLVAKQASFNI